MQLKKISAAFAAMTLALTATAASASDFPNKPIRVLVGFAPGGANDIIARLLAPKMEAYLKQSIIVENRPGAGGIIAADAAMKATPDGHTVFVCTTGPISIQPALPQPIPFDVNAMTPVTLIGNAPYLMLVSKDIPVNSVDEFLSYSKANPGKVNFASSGNGTTSHLAGEMLRAQAGIDIVHVPYKGAGQAMVDLNSGRVSLMFDQAMSSLPHLRSGSLKALAVASDHRLKGYPDLPTVDEAGLPGFNPTPWAGLCTGPGVPAEAVKKLQEATAFALNDPEIRERFDRDGVEPVGSTPEEFAVFLKADREMWGKAVKQADIQL